MQLHSPLGDDLSPELYTVAKVSLFVVSNGLVNGSSAMFLFFHEVSVFREYRIVSDRVWAALKSHHSLSPDFTYGDGPVSSSPGVNPAEKMCGVHLPRLFLTALHLSA